MVILSLTQLGRYYYEYAVLQPEIAELASATKLIKPHSTYAMDMANSASETLGDVKHVSPFHHAPCYYGLVAKDIVYLDNYEAGSPYFPVDWASRPEGDSDYVLAWDHAEDTRDLDRYKDKYDLIYSTRRMKLFQLKQKQSESILSDGDRTDGE